MNKIFHVIYSVAYQSYIVCSELAKSQGKTKSRAYQSVGVHPVDYILYSAKILFFAFPLTIPFPAQAQDICGKNLSDDSTLRENCTEIMEINEENGVLMESVEKHEQSDDTEQDEQEQKVDLDDVEQQKLNKELNKNQELDSEEADNSHLREVPFFTKGQGKDSIQHATWGLAIGKYSIALGYKARAIGQESIALGHKAKAIAKESIAIGNDAEVKGEGSIAIGDHSSVTVNGGVALGQGSVANRKAREKGYLAGDEKGVAWISTHGAIAIGDGEKVTRQITGVAAGSQDTDAVNLAQLKYLKNYIEEIHGTKRVTIKAGENISVEKDQNKNSFTISSKDTYVTNMQLNDGTLTLERNEGKDSLAVDLSSLKTNLAGSQTTDLVGAGTKADPYKVEVKNTTLGVSKTGTLEAISDNDANKFVKAQNLYKTLSSMGFTAKVDGAKEGTFIKTGDVLSFKGDDNLTISRDGSTFAFGISKTPTFDSITVNNAPINAKDATNKQYVDDGRTTVASKDNSIKVTPTGNAAVGYHFDVALDHLQLGKDVTIAYRANGGEGQQVSLAKGFNFVDGKNTIATTGENGVISFSLESDLKDINAIGNGENGAHITLNKDNRNIYVNNGSIYGVKSAIADLEGDTFIDKITNGQKDFGDYAVNVQDLYQSIQATKDELQFNISFAGDNGGNYLVDSAGKTVSIIGGAMGPLSQNNIGVMSDAKGQLSVQLAEDLAGLNSILVGKGDKPININGQAGTITGLTNTVWKPDIFVSGQAATEDQLNQAYSDLLNKIEHARSEDLHYGDQHGNSGDVSLKEGLTFNDGKNTVATTAPNGNVSVDLKDNITLGKGDKEININGDTGVVTVGKGGNQVKVDGSQGSVSAGTGDKQVSLNGKDGTITAGDVNSQDKTHVTVNNAGISIKPAKKDEKEKKEVSLTAQGLNNGGQRITNVAEGKDATDAVNMGQLNAFKQSMGAEIYQINDRVHKIDKNARAGIAGAAAIATLPQEFRAGRSQIAIGSSYYRGESAFAIGYSQISNNSKWTLKLNGSTNSRSDTIVGAGLGYSW